MSPWLIRPPFCLLRNPVGAWPARRRPGANPASGCVRRLATLVLALAAVASPAAAQINVTSPSAETVVPAAAEFATRELQDPWDMNERTDLGWFLNSVDQPLNGFTGVSFAGGVFHAVSSTGGPNVFLLETGNPNAAPVGKIGTNHPINADYYRRLTYRLCHSGAEAQPISSTQFYWHRQTIYSDVSTPGAVFVYGGCHIYSFDLRTLSEAGMPPVSGLNQYPWGGTMRALRLDPTNLANQTVDIDFVALTAVNDAATFRNITWSGGAVDIYLDTNDTAADGTLGVLVKDKIPARSVSGGSYTFQVGALPPGDYYVAMRPAGTSTPLTYSPGYYRVTAVPTLSFLAPHPEGSGDDFATTFLGNSWDMDSTADLDHVRNVTGASITSMTAETPAGVPLGTPGVFRGTSTAASPGFVGDPILYPLWSGKRGAYYRIDTSRYRLLTVEMGIDGARDINRGSIARVVWKRADEAVENVSQDIIINHRSGANVLSTFTVDMAALPLESDPGGSPSLSGWTGLVDHFRIDPHEFSAPRAFQIRRVKLAALERADDAYPIRWVLGGAEREDATLSLYYDLDRAGFDGVPIAFGLDPDNAGPQAGSFVWNTSGLGNGPYYVYAEVVAGGKVINRAYARWPVVVDHGWQPLPRIALDRTKLYYAATSAGATKTGAQEVAVSVIGGGSPGWTATSVTPGCGFVQIAGASGSGSGRFRVAMQDRSYSNGTFACAIRVDAPATSNSPQFVEVVFAVRSSSQAPFGAIGTPPDHAAGLAGGVPVSGWALDDLEVARVEIWRDPVTGETPAHANGKIYVGVAAMVPGARPDVEAAFPAVPLNYRAGWGYMLLTNMLPSQGNGTYRLHAYAVDVENKTTLLGSRWISCDNAHAVRPFGTIDTPAQGGVASGKAFVNFGWVLAHQPHMIPTDGSTIRVYVDGTPRGHPVYNNYRADIATLFPGYANSNGAVGYFVIDTTTLQNGLHTIAWGVTDSGWNAEGIGSRYFTVSNTGGSALLAPGHGPELGRAAAELASLAPIEGRLDVRAAGVEAPNGPPRAAGAVVTMPELGLLDVGVQSGGGLSEAYLVASGRLAALPPGASLDVATGRLRWHPGPGFAGSYRLALVRGSGDRREAAEVTVRIVPRRRASATGESAGTASTIARPGLLPFFDGEPSGGHRPPQVGGRRDPG